MPTIEYLTASRRHIRTQITKLYDKMWSTYEELGPIEVSAMLSKMNLLDVEVSKLNNEISALMFESHGDTEAFTNELDSSEIYADKINESKTLLSSKKLSLAEPQTTPIQVASESIKPTKLKLPELPLPKYSHAKGETLVSFLAAFESVVKASNSSCYEKFVFLKRQLLGPPLVLVVYLELSINRTKVL